MKKIILAIASILVVGSLSACRIITYTGPGGTKLSMKSFGNRTSWGDFTMGPNGVTLSNLNNDQVAGIQAVGTVAIQAAQMALMAAQKPTNTPVLPTLNVR